MPTVLTRLFVTLLYSWSFEFPLRIDEWVRRLYRPMDSAIKGDSLSLAQAAICKLAQRNQVTTDGVYFAPASKKFTTDMASIRSQRLAFSQAKLAEIKPLVRLCQWLPWVAGVAVTGSVAVENAKKDADVDFMIVCLPSRMWLVRPLLILFSQLHGKRRTWRGEEGNSWCFNLWLEQHTQSVPPSQRSLYTAYEVCQARWIISKAHTKELFFAANRWVTFVVPRLFTSATTQSVEHEQKTVGVGIPLLYNIIDLANYISFKIQYFYMRRHMTRERVSFHFAAFHPRDTKVNVLQAVRLLLEKSDQK